MRKDRIMSDDLRNRTRGTIVMAAGVPLPTPRKNANAVRGGAIGGGLGALVAGLFVFPPLGIAVAAATGAFVGAAIGSDADQRQS
jgi:uncharacterized membrane protein